METEIKFKNLSGWLKTAVIIAWAIGGIYAFVLLIEVIRILLFG